MEFQKAKRKENPKLFGRIPYPYSSQHFKLLFSELWSRVKEKYGNLINFDGLPNRLKDNPPSPLISSQIIPASDIVKGTNKSPPQSLLSYFNKSKKP